MIDAAPEPVLQALRVQAGFCRRLGSPFSAMTLDLLADRATSPGPVARLLEPWRARGEAQLIADATPLRLLGGLHYLVLTGAAPELAAIYQRSASGGDAAELAPALEAALGRHERDLAEFMTSPPQTNEVRRALALVGGFLTIAADTGLPLSILEIGASAGLLQSFDQFRYEPTGWSLGPTDASVQLPGEWAGGPPPLDAALKVVSRRACDQAPVDIRDERQALKLQAYIWPDQPDRLERLRAAVALARSRDVSVERADALEWVRAHLRPTPGAATVLFHSVMWQYMPPSTQVGVSAAIAAAGVAATRKAPVFWLRMEPSPTEPTGPMEVRLTSWPGGRDERLARCHPHGAWVEWLGPRKQAPERS